MPYESFESEFGFCVVSLLGHLIIIQNVHVPGEFCFLFFFFCSLWFSCHGNTILGLVVSDL